MKKFVVRLVLGVSFGFGAFALEQVKPDLKMQIFKDLQLVDEIESINDGEASRLWIRSSDEVDDNSGFGAEGETGGEIRGLSVLGS